MLRTVPLVIQLLPGMEAYVRRRAARAHHRRDKVTSEGRLPVSFFVPVGPDATSSSAPVSSPHTQILLPDPLFIVTRYF
jgi:hypothetical protein